MFHFLSCTCEFLPVFEQCRLFLDLSELWEQHVILQITQWCQHQNGRLIQKRWAVRRRWFESLLLRSQSGACLFPEFLRAMMRHELTATENGRVEFLMVNLHWLTVLWSFHVYIGMLNILSIRFKLMIVTFTLLHLGLVHVCAWCNVLTRDVRSGALFATPRSCGFAALSYALRSRGVNVVFHLSHLFGHWFFSSR